MKRYDVVALGELLIDLISSGLGEQGNPQYDANPGGAPCNVLAMLSKLGHRTAFIGKVGQDAFGNQLTEALQQAGIEASCLHYDSQIPTTLAVVSKLPDGDRAFSFYRNPGADLMLNETELDPELLQDCQIFHYGSLSMSDEPCRTATKKAMELAQEAGALLSFDPNLRKSLWSSERDAREQILFGLAHCHILKISDNEIQWLSGRQDCDSGISWLLNQFSIPLVLLSMGKQGSCAYHCGRRVEVPAHGLPNTIETTGAGDTFFGAVLHYIIENGWHSYNDRELTEMLCFASAAAAIITTRKGALQVMPTQSEIAALLSNE